MKAQKYGHVSVITIKLTNMGIISLKVILYSYLILKKMNGRITDS